MIFKNQIVENLDFEKYISDPALSSTKLRDLLVAPAHYHGKHVTKEIEDKDTAAKKLGRLAHKAFLESEEFLSRKIVMPNFGDQRSKDNKNAKIQWLSDVPKNAIVLTQDEAEKITKMVLRLNSHSLIKNILKDSTREISGFWTEFVDGVEIDQKFRADIVVTKEGTLLDYKTCSDLDSFEWDFKKFKYHVQLAHYKVGLKARGFNISDVAIIAQQTNEAHLIKLFPVDDTWIEHGEARRKIGLKKFSECTKLNYWDQGYEEVFESPLSPRPWDLLEGMT